MITPYPDVFSMPGSQVDPDLPIAIYGTGAVARDVLHLLRKQQRDVCCFLDHRASTANPLEGLGVRRPDDPAWTVAERANIQIVIANLNPQVDVPVMRIKLQAMGWQRVIPFLDFFHANEGDLPSRNWLVPRSYYRDKQTIIAEAARLFCDGKSRALYNSILKFRYSGDYSDAPVPEPLEQYFPADIPPWRSPLRCIDCGAFDGDTVRELKRRNLRVEAIASFEPDLANYKKLVAELATLENSAETTAWPCGVWNETTQLRFSMGLGSASTVNTQGETVIQCVSLDEALPRFAPNLIKMDIEGAEFCAVQGATQIISCYRSGLAICVYHTPDHLWSIPLEIASWNLGYRFFLRCHGFNSFETVLYALAD